MKGTSGGRGYHVLALAAFAPSGFETSGPSSCWEIWLVPGSLYRSFFVSGTILGVLATVNLWGRGQGLPISSLRHNIHEKKKLNKVQFI